MNEIIAAIFACRGYVFGGYVRDLLAGSKPGDIDCFIPEHFQHMFWKKLLDSFTEFSVVKVQDYQKSGYPDFYGPTYERALLQRLVVHGDHEDIQVDVVSDPTFSPDCDVNMLKMTKEGITLMDWRLELASVLQNIHEHQAKTFATCSPRRKRKMISKGWDLL